MRPLAVVTGASMGTGLEVARQRAARGFVTCGRAIKADCQIAAPENNPRSMR
jgi:NAD(P)-dependent dehydrogenase (short-subunit alcohol dehydrogenase family)